jgi:hypothetical protein
MNSDTPPSALICLLPDFLAPEEELRTAAPSNFLRTSVHFGAAFSMSSCASRTVSLTLAALFSLLIAVLFWAGCGGSSNNSSSNSTANNNPLASGSQPAAGSGGSSGTTSGGSGSSGGLRSSGSGGSGGSGSTTGAAYFYVAVAGDTARIRGYKIDSSAASLAEVPGSPFNQQGGSESGVVAVSERFVYGSEAKVALGISTTITAFLC